MNLKLKNKYGELQIGIISIETRDTCGIITIKDKEGFSERKLTYYFNAEDARKLFDFFRKILIELNKKEIEVLEKLDYDL